MGAANVLVVGIVILQLSVSVLGIEQVCTQDSDCPPGKPACFYNSCKDPCEGVCGENANCDLRSGRIPICFCPRDMTGDPFLGCRKFTPDDLCKPNPCGAHANCHLGYDKTNKERPVCTCHAGYSGDPIIGCDTAKCVDGLCGENATCELRNGTTPVCSCPKGRTGDPFVSCRYDLCEPNPCGANAKCHLGFDKTNKERPVCTCHAGYSGDPIAGCVTGECVDNTECPDHQACFDYKCKNPCQSQCGVNAMCNPRRHLAVCACLPGYNGDALTQCH